MRIKRLQLTAAGGSVQRLWLAAGGSEGRTAAGVRSVVLWRTRGRS